MSQVGKLSPFGLTLVHLSLLVASVIATFPVFRVMSISVRDTGTISATTSDGLPSREDTGLVSYLQFLIGAIVPAGSETKEQVVATSDTATDTKQEPVAAAEVDDLMAEFEALDEAETTNTQRHWYSNYVDLFSKHMFLQWIYNSLIISLSASLIGVFLAATSAYAFARFEFPGKKSAIAFLFTTQMIPAPMMIIPVYLVIKSLNLGNTYAGLVLAMSVTSLPFSIMVLKGYFDTVPKSLEEAARVDGCSPITAFFRILLPLSTPALAIAFLFSFTTAWSEFLLASTLIDDVELRPWTLGLMAFSGSFDARWGLFAAGSVVIAIPSMMLFLYSAKYVISGLTIGGVKG